MNYKLYTKAANINVSKLSIVNGSVKDDKYDACKPQMSKFLVEKSCKLGCNEVQLPPLSGDAESNKLT